MTPRNLEDLMLILGRFNANGIRGHQAKKRCAVFGGETLTPFVDDEKITNLIPPDVRNQSIVVTEPVLGGLCYEGRLVGKRP